MPEIKIKNKYTLTYKNNFTITPACNTIVITYHIVTIKYSPVKSLSVYFLECNTILTDNKNMISLGYFLPPTNVT